QEKLTSRTDYTGGSGAIQTIIFLSRGVRRVRPAQRGRTTPGQRHGASALRWTHPTARPCFGGAVWLWSATHRNPGPQVNTKEKRHGTGGWVGLVGRSLYGHSPC